MPTLIVEKQSVSREYFPVGKEINEDYIKLLRGLACKDWTESDFQNAIADLQQQRNNARSWGKAAIEAMIVSQAKNVGLKIQNMSALKESFREDCSPNFAARLWSACYGAFDRMPRWEFTLEKQYMEFARLEYEEIQEGATDKKGCFARLFVEVKKEIIKSINRVGKSGHGGTIRVKRTSEEVKALGSAKRRKKGCTLGDFFHYKLQAQQSQRN